MPDDSGRSDGNNQRAPTLKEQQHDRGRDGKSVHGGDLAPPNKEDAGRVIAPEKGEPEQQSH